MTAKEITMMGMALLIFCVIAGVLLYLIPTILMEHRIRKKGIHVSVITRLFSFPFAIYRNYLRTVRKDDWLVRCVRISPWVLIIGSILGLLVAVVGVSLNNS